MSGEYFNVEDEGSKLYTEYIKDKRPMSTRKEGKTESDEQLQDLEVQLELAEDRCSALKGQLDYMKNLYSGKPQKVNRKFSIVTPKRPVDSSSASGDSLHNKIQEIKEENTHDTEAKKNIGIIINGITDSVNRLSDLHLQITDSPHQKVHSENSHVTNIEIKPIKPKISNNILNSNASTNKPVKKECYQAGFLKTGKRREFPLLSCRGDLKRYSSSMIHKNKNRAKNLVEIYHNKAVKGSDSDHSCHDIRGRSKTSRSHVERIMDIPKLALHVPQVPITWDPPEQTDAKVNKFNNISNINSFPQHDYKRAMMSDVNQYQLPTIASRMKQVAKCYFNAYNFKAVPFCPATSTTPSHNIGINLQQVMSMMKTKQPISGISPTLAHNIGLAAERINNNHGSVMISTTSSRTCSTHVRPNTCPLSNIRMNYHHLQEMAKAIPEEELADGYEENNKESPVITNIITGPSGDMEIKTKKMPEWMADPNSCTERCTCVTMPTTDLHHLVNKYQLNQPPNSFNTLTPQQRTVRSVSKKTRPIRMSLVTKNNGIIRNQKNKNEITDAPPNDADINITMQGKEKTLKGVLTNLHNEFNIMNTRYEELSKLGEGMSDENVKELEGLDKDLSTKEEEITMVMDLYKEVLALKQQVQSLKRKSSQASVMSQFPRSGSEYNNPKAAFHLTKLLKQIQLYQSHYKKTG